MSGKCALSLRLDAARLIEVRWEYGRYLLAARSMQKVLAASTVEFGQVFTEVTTGCSRCMLGLLWQRAVLASGGRDAADAHKDGTRIR